MTSPISSNWFYYTTMASMAKAMPAINRADAANYSLNNTQDVSSLFSMLLESMMQGLENNQTTTSFTEEDQSFSQLTNMPFPFNLQQYRRRRSFNKSFSNYGPELQTGTVPQIGKHTSRQIKRFGNSFHQCR